MGVWEREGKEMIGKMEDEAVIRARYWSYCRITYDRTPPMQIYGKDEFGFCNLSPSPRKQTNKQTI
jgi:hypothetical protein